MGGTMIHVAKRWTGAGLKKGGDSIGRWSKITMEGKERKKISIYSVYRVCHNTLEDAGGDTVWMQQYTALLQSGSSQPNPRQQILDDLERDIITLQQDEEHYIIVCIDACAIGSVGM